MLSKRELSRLEVLAYHLDLRLRQTSLLTLFSSAGQWYDCLAGHRYEISSPDQTIPAGDVVLVCASGHRRTIPGTEGSFGIYEPKISNTMGYLLHQFEVSFDIPVIGQNRIDVRQFSASPGERVYNYTLYKGDMRRWRDALPHVKLVIF